MSIDQGAVTNALLQQWDAIDEALAPLSEEQWLTPSVLPGWTVHDVVSHMVGTESMLLGEQPPVTHVEPHAAHVHNEIGAFNERWVEGLRDRTGAQMLESFRDTTGRRRTALAALTPDEWAAESWTPVGKDSYGRFMRIRLFDCWMHEHDIRDALGVPSDEGGTRGELAFAEIDGAIGYLVGKKGKAPDGSRVEIELTGPLARTIRVAVDGRAQRVDAFDASPTTTITLDSRLFVRLTGGRTTAEAHIDEISIAGDRTLGKQIVHHFAFTM
ncbi:MAG TPA: maleylpyruvate isomerase family mycothiol-dependent enzyme [Aldersonia sp.]